MRPGWADPALLGLGTATAMHINRESPPDIHKSHIACPWSRTRRAPALHDAALDNATRQVRQHRTAPLSEISESSDRHECASLKLEDLRRIKAKLLEEAAQFALPLFARQIAGKMLHHARWAADEHLCQVAEQRLGHELAQHRL